jgi:hypothetical protein
VFIDLPFILYVLLINFLFKTPIMTIKNNNNKISKIVAGILYTHQGGGSFCSAGKLKAALAVE